MSDLPVAEALKELTPAQAAAVGWNEGPMFVLAGPGSGKTRVLTTRVARLLEETPNKSFRVLALTFTNKAADEMTARVASLVADQAHRASIGTFHSFCMQMPSSMVRILGSIRTSRYTLLRRIASNCSEKLSASKI